MVTVRIQILLELHCNPPPPPPHHPWEQLYSCREIFSKNPDPAQYFATSDTAQYFASSDSKSAQDFASSDSNPTKNFASSDPAST